MTRIALLDYGMGNLHSAAKALEHVGAQVDVTHDAQVIAQADKIVFPGVGAMRDCMAGMHAHGIDAAVKHAVFNKPVMAICVGMQALMQHSQENGGVDCLGIFAGDVQQFSVAKGLKVPHMGWNEVTPVAPDHFLWRNIPTKTRFYFVHSYYVVPSDAALIASTCDYGLPFCASLLQDNVFATQFHPEKSDKAGLQLLKNFVEWSI